MSTDAARFHPMDQFTATWSTFLTHNSKETKCSALAPTVEF
jgi:hypothetical protein